MRIPDLPNFINRFSDPAYSISEAQWYDKKTVYRLYLAMLMEEQKRDFTFLERQRIARAVAAHIRDDKVFLLHCAGAGEVGQIICVATPAAPWESSNAVAINVIGQYVEPNHRGISGSFALMRAAHRYAQKRRAVRIDISTHEGSKRPGFFTRLGFRKTDELYELGGG